MLEMANATSPDLNLPEARTLTELARGITAPQAADAPRTEGARTATPAINDGKWRHSAALSEFGPLFLNGEHRSVNRKVQGSNPWSGANFRIPDRSRPFGDLPRSVAIL